MKYWQTALSIFALSASLALAEDFKTVNGKEYKNAQVSRVEADGIVIRTKMGISKIYFVELPKDVQERFHYDPAQAARLAAAQHETATPQNTALAEQERQQEQQSRAEARTTNTRTVLEVESDQQSFLDKPFMLQGTIGISTYYNYGYNGAEETHYSFEITDSTGRGCAAYMERSKAGNLRERLLSAGSSLKGVFTVVLLGGRYYYDIKRPSIHASGLLVELLDYRLEQ